MRAQEFERVGGELLEVLERLTVAEHRALFEEVLGEPWSPPRAYRWIRYEDPDPIGQLLRAGERLEELWRERGGVGGVHAAGAVRTDRVRAARVRFEAFERSEVERARRLAQTLGYRG